MRNIGLFRGWLLLLPGTSRVSFSIVEKFRPPSRSNQLSENAFCYSGRMSIWKSKNADQQTVDRLRREQETREAQISWVKQADREQITALFISLRDEMEAAAIAQRKPKDLKAHETALKLFDQVQHYWFLVDRKLTDDQQTLTLFEMLKVKLPEVVSAYRTRAVKVQSRKALREPFYANKEDAFYDYKTCVTEEFSSLIGVLFTMRNDVTVSGHIASVNSTVNRAKPFALLNLPADDADLCERIFNLITLHEAATQGVSSIEDAYFLEESAHVYVPDALNLYANFKLASKPVQVAARAALIDQLDIIMVKLSEIVSRLMDYQLQDIQAQADFLRLKVNSGEVARQVPNGDSKLMAALSGGSN